MGVARPQGLYIMLHAFGRASLDRIVIESPISGDQWALVESRYT